MLISRKESPTVEFSVIDDRPNCSSKAYGKAKTVTLVEANRAGSTTVSRTAVPAEVDPRSTAQHVGSA